MADFAYDVLRYVHDKYGPKEPLFAALQHEGRGIPRQAKCELVERFGRDMALGEALKKYPVHA